MARQRRKVAAVSVTRRVQLGHVADISRLAEDQKANDAARIGCRQ
jgi:hypothetical protein